MISSHLSPPSSLPNASSPTNFYAFTPLSTSLLQGALASQPQSTDGIQQLSIIIRELIRSQGELDRMIDIAKELEVGM
jgi:hypothetical protein